MTGVPSAEQVILAAVGSLGAVNNADLPVQAATRVADILALFDSGSDASRVYAGLTSPDSKKVYGWLEAVVKEKSSNRAVITLRTKPNDAYNPDGIDKARSERLESEYARALANKAHALIGHNVIVSMEVQTYKDKDGKASKMRVFWDVTDRGEAPEPDYSSDSRS